MTVPPGGNVIGVGLDLVELGRFARALTRGNFAKRVFTLAEREACGGSVASLAARFAAREAALKAMGSGLWSIDLSDISVAGGRGGAPELNVVGRAGRLAEHQGIRSWKVSLTHTVNYAGAVVIALA